MRLYNIYYVCKTCLPVLENVDLPSTQRSSKWESSQFQIYEWNDCNTALNELRTIACLKKYVDDLYDLLSNLDTDTDVLIVYSDIKNKFIYAFNNIMNAMKTIIDLYESMELSGGRSGIDVKIPKCNSLKEYMDYLKELEFIFTQCPYLTINDEEIKFDSVDVGSQWITFFIVSAGTLVILNNLAKLIDKAVSIKSHLTTVKHQEELLEIQKQKNEIADEIINAFKIVKRTMMNKYIEDLEDELGKLKDGEERGKVEKSLEKLIYLLDKGVEIYSSIETPNEIKELFPVSENNPILSDNIIRFLSDKKDK